MIIDSSANTVGINVQYQQVGIQYVSILNDAVECFVVLAGRPVTITTFIGRYIASDIMIMA